MCEKNFDLIFRKYFRLETTRFYIDICLSSEEISYTTTSRLGFTSCRLGDRGSRSGKTTQRTHNKLCLIQTNYSSHGYFIGDKYSGFI